MLPSATIPSLVSCVATMTWSFSGPLVSATPAVFAAILQCTCVISWRHHHVELVYIAPTCSTFVFQRQLCNSLGGAEEAHPHNLNAVSYGMAWNRSRCYSIPSGWCVVRNLSCGISPVPFGCTSFYVSTFCEEGGPICRLSLIRTRLKSVSSSTQSRHTVACRITLFAEPAVSLLIELLSCLFLL